MLAFRQKSILENILFNVGGETLVLEGSDFGELDDVTVYLMASDGMKTELVINETAFSSSRIEAAVPSMPADQYTVVVYEAGVGNAVFRLVFPLMPRCMLWKLCATILLLPLLLTATQTNSM